MCKLSSRQPEELREIEQFIQDLMIDAQHPVNNPRHPLHHECMIAMHELMERADFLRNSCLIR